MSTPTLPARAVWQNWVRNESFETRFVEPRSESEVVDLIKLARSRSEQVRVVGTGHSTSPLHRNKGMLMSLDNMQGIISADAARSRAVVHSGTKIRKLGDPLWELGLSLPNQGEIDRQSIAGAMSTGTHGTGLRLKSLSAMLQRARLVAGTGEIVEVDESTPDELRAAQVSLGMLGVITEMELQLLPAYEITEWIGHVPFDDVFPHCLELARDHRSFSILWFPTHQAAVNFDLVPPDGDGSDVCFVKIYEEGDVGNVDAGPIAAYGGVRRVDRAYRIYPDAWEPEFYEMEYMMPVEAGLECMPKVRRMVRDEFPENHMPVQLRFAAADEALLSQNYGRDSAVVSVTTEPSDERPSEDFFGRCDDLFTEHGGRPHWGKWHYTSVERLRSQLPEYDKFREIRRRFDPDGIFLNEYLEPLFA